MPKVPSSEVVCSPHYLRRLTTVASTSRHRAVCDMAEVDAAAEEIDEAMATGVIACPNVVARLKHKFQHEAKLAVKRARRAAQNLNRLAYVRAAQ